MSDGMVSAEDVTVLPPRHEVEWDEYRGYVRKIRCVVCQLTDGKNLSGDMVEKLDYEPELVDISDPHHVTTRGAGGVDAENLVPLCRSHHDEFGSDGISTFELRYDISLKLVAKHIFDLYMDSLVGTDRSQIAFASHQQIVSRIEALRISGMELGQLLVRFREAVIDGKHMYEILGFESFKDYLGSPFESGGLDMSQRTAYRCIGYAEAKNETDGDERIEKIGSTKAQIILPLLKQAKDDAERDEILDTAQALTSTDLHDWKNDRLGLPDRREEMVGLMQDEVTAFLTDCGLQMTENILGGLTQRVLKVAREYRRLL